MSTSKKKSTAVILKDLSKVLLDSSRALEESTKAKPDIDEDSSAEEGE